MVLLCPNCGVELAPGATECPKCKTPVTLDTYGYTIRPSERGGGFLLYDGDEPIELVRESQKWMDDTAHRLRILPSGHLNAALVKAKATPKEKTQRTETKLDYEIATSTITRLAPDGGVVDGRAYMGLWLPVKVTTEYGKKLDWIFHLLFSDGELIPGDPETLSEYGIYLTTNPIYTPLKISVEMVLNLSKLEPVDPTQLLTQLLKILSTYIEFDDPRYYTLTAIWIIGTYFYKRFSAYPYLFINAIKRSGKTKLLTVLSLLTYNAVFSANMSTSSLFRLTQSAGATTLADETEDLNDPERKADFRQLFNSGYKRGAVVYRSEKGPNDTWVPTPYDPYSPKGLANIKGLEDVLEDRCLPITMKRGRNKAIINRDVPIDDLIWLELRNTLSRFYLQEWAAIGQEYEDTTDVDSVVSACSACSVGIGGVENKKNIFSGRDWELWRPLLSIAKKYFFILSTPLEPTLTTLPTLPTPLESLLTLAVDIITEKQAENVTDTGEALLMMGLLALVQKDAWYGLNDIKAAASLYSDELPKWFNNTWIGRALKRLSFKEKRRRGRGMEYRFTPETVKDMADRMAVELPPDEPTKEKPTPPPGLEDYADDDPNIEHLKRVATETIKRAGYLTRKDFFNIMDAAGHQNQDVILNVLKQIPRAKVTDKAVSWLKEEET